MDIALKQNSISLNLMDSKIKSVIEALKFSKIEKVLSDALEDMSNTNPVNYIGDLNRADIMH